jgi:hypothetical protein
MIRVDVHGASIYTTTGWLAPQPPLEMAETTPTPSPSPSRVRRQMGTIGLDEQLRKVRVGFEMQKRLYELKRKHNPPQLP